MSSIEGWGMGWNERLVQTLIVFTAVTVLVLIMRRACRGLLGAERVVWLWLLLPLAMLMTWMPHVAAGVNEALPAWAYAIGDVLRSGPPDALRPSASNGCLMLLGVWLAGALAGTLVATMAQQRFRRTLRGSTCIENANSHWPILRAPSSDIGPASVGAWRVCIVVPADFETRFDLLEQALILEHEAIHARRRDGATRALALGVALLLWFHPLAWIALRAFREDQELACDAAVLRRCPAMRRRYALTMLKTRLDQTLLPIGCGWLTRHPLTERIAMLNRPLPSFRRRRIGTFISLFTAAIVASVAYASSAPAPVRSGAASEAERFEVNVNLAISHDDGHSKNVQRAQLNMCLYPQKRGTIAVGEQSIEVTLAPLKSNRVALTVMVTSGGKPVGTSQISGALDQPLHATGQGADKQPSYEIDITPSRGCPEASSDAKPVSGPGTTLVSEHVESGQVSAVAASIAKKAGWTLRNPQLLTQKPVSLDFEKIPAARAMRLVADVAGVQMRIEGRQVIFAPK